MLGVLAFAMGASVGSFLNVVADRLPSGRSLVHPRSYCESCQRTLDSADLLPVLSYLWLRGKCRHCGAAIPLRLVWVEIATGALFTLIFVRYGFGVEFVVLCVSVSFLVAVALIDLEHGLILNRMVYPTIGVLLVFAPFWTQLGLSRALLGNSGLLASFFNSLLAGVGAFLLFLIIMLAYPRGMGGGDVKLVGLLGLLVGYPGVLVTLWIAVISGGAVAVSLLLLRKKGRKDAVPFGPFLALGAIAALLAGSDIVSRYQEATAQVLNFWA